MTTSLRTLVMSIKRHLKIRSFHSWSSMKKLETDLCVVFCECTEFSGYKMNILLRRDIVTLYHKLYVLKTQKIL